MAVSCVSWLKRMRESSLKGSLQTASVPRRHVTDGHHACGKVHNMKTERRNHTGRYLFSAVCAAMLLMHCPAAAQQVQELYPDEFEGSSVLPASEYGDYWVRNVGDHNLSTAWVEGVPGNGYGEYFDLYIPEGTMVVGASIFPGYLKNEDLFWKNAAPASLTFSSNGVSTQADVSAAASSYQSAAAGVNITFQTPLVSDGKIRVTVQDIRGGNKYEDTCISELHLMGYMASLLPSGVVVDGGAQPAGRERAVFERITENGYERAVVRGYDEEQRVIWTYETASYQLAQLNRVNDIGLFQGKYYFVEDGTVITLNPADGTVIWKSSVKVGSHAEQAFDFDSAGNLYISGYLGPDLTILSPEGKTIGQFATLMEDYYWPFIVDAGDDGFVKITFESADLGNGQYGSLKVDVRNWL